LFIVSILWREHAIFVLYRQCPEIPNQPRDAFCLISPLKVFSSHITQNCVLHDLSLKSAR
ncbi:hypothetical protein JZM21_32455, partial [Escherichia coli]|uniref:hypothetical protein n=1 Tax=Escherichia coli TaxID=562 RepID=UPI0019D04ADE